MPGFLWGVEQLVPVGDILKALSPRRKGFPQAAPAEPSLASEKPDPEEGINGLTQEEWLEPDREARPTLLSLPLGSRVPSTWDLSALSCPLLIPS